MSVLKGINAIRRWVMGQMTKKSNDGIMITLPDMKKVELNTSITAERLMRNGVDPNSITSVNQVENIINQLNKPKVVSQGDPKFKGIMSRMTGKNVIKGDFGPGFKKEIEKMKGKVDDDLPPPGSRGGADDIAAPFQSAEESLKNMIEAEATNPRFLNYTIDSMLKMEPIDAMKEANKIIKREGPYKNLSSKEAKKILDDTEDHIFERNFKTPDDPDFDPESMADGGRIGFGGGSDMGTVADSKGKVGKGKGGYQGTGTGPVERPSGGNRDDDNIISPPSKTKIPTEIKSAINLGGDISYLKNLIELNPVGIMKNIGGKLIMDKIIGDQTSLNTEDNNMMLADAETDNEKLLKELFNPDTGVDEFIDKKKESEDIQQQLLQEIQNAADGGRIGAMGGGRIGYKKGTVDLARRGFMKAAAGVGAGIGALKMGALKLFGKEGTKQVTKNIIKTDNVPGKPEWFDALVTKVINQGENVTKKFATQEREIVHKLDIDKFEDVTVYRNMDTGEIRVSYESPTNVGEQSVDLVYKKPLPDEGDPRPSAEFYAVEPEPRVVNRDGDMEFDGENFVNSVDDLMSDTSKLKIIAKGDAKPTLKEFVTSKKKKDAAKKLNEDPMEQADYIEGKYGPGPEPDFDDIENFQSGGIARMLGE